MPGDGTCEGSGGYRSWAVHAADPSFSSPHLVNIFLMSGLLGLLLSGTVAQGYLTRSPVGTRVLFVVGTLMSETPSDSETPEGKGRAVFQIT